MNSLTDFQHALTDALRQSKVSTNSFVALKLDDDLWLIDLMLIKEASVPPTLARIARAPAWVVGIANFRGEVWDVLDMKMLLKKESTITPKWGWVTLLRPQNDHHVALLWSEIVEIAPKEEYDPVPYETKEPLCKALWSDAQGHTWKELDIEQITGPSGLIASWRHRMETEGGDNNGSNDVK